MKRLLWPLRWLVLLGISMTPVAGRAAEKPQWHVRGRVVTLRGEPLHDAAVSVEANLPGSVPRRLESNLKGEFDTEFDAPAGWSKALRFTVTATKDGYFVAREEAEFASPEKTQRIVLAMRKDQEDAQQLSLEELTSLLGQRLRAPAGRVTSPSPAGAPCGQGARELLDVGNAQNATRLLREAVTHETESVECSTLLGLALLNQGSWFGATRQLNQAARLSVSRPANPRRPEPFLVLAVLETWSGELRAAAGFLLRALDADPADPLVLQELGRCLVLQQKVQAADAYLVKAIQLGAPVQSHFLRAQALLEEGDAEKAAPEMAAFLGNRKSKQLPPAQRYLWGAMEQRVALESSGKVSSVVDQPLPELLQSLPELKGLQPSEEQAQLGVILKKVGQNVAAFFKGFPNTSSREQVRMERLHRDGKVADVHSQDFQYLVLARLQKSSEPSFEEYRTNPSSSTGGQAGFGGRFMVTQGFASAALHLHPLFQRGSRFRYLGRQAAAGRDSLVVAFAQRPETAQILESFRIGDVGNVVLIQGLVWVDASSYQIERMRTDLLKPLPGIRLDRQTTDINFTEVTFTEVKSDLWLPREVAVTVAWNGRVFRNRHTYSDFRLFNVDSRQRAAAAQAGKDSASQTDP